MSATSELVAEATTQIPKGDPPCGQRREEMAVIVVVRLVTAGAAVAAETGGHDVTCRSTIPSAGVRQPLDEIRNCLREDFFGRSSTRSCRPRGGDRAVSSGGAPVPPSRAPAVPASRVLPCLHRWTPRRRPRHRKARRRSHRDLIPPVPLPETVWPPSTVAPFAPPLVVPHHRRRCDTAAR
jgi:hypothetical protein